MEFHPSSRLLLTALMVAVSGTAESQAGTPSAGSSFSRPSAVTRSDTGRTHVADTVRVTGRIDNLIGVARSASEGHIGAAELRHRPIAREGELLESIPGLIVTQHSGDGKANQYFLRGFNLDHGTDFATRIEGMPLNMPSHGHGQGYTDLNFLIPELVDYIDYKLGVYHAELGDFASAGGAEFHLLKRVDNPVLIVGTGANGFRRAVTVASSRVRSGDLLLGGEAKGYDGPWQRKEDIRKLSGVARYSVKRGASQYSVLGLAYHNRWNANDQIPRRAVTEGLISRFGQIDTTDGGNASRYSLSASWHHLAASSIQDVQLYGIHSNLDLFSNFGYLLDDESRGDQFNQTDRRTVFGINATHTQSITTGGVGHIAKFGVQSRADIINGLGLYHSRARERFATVREDRVRETATGLFFEVESRPTPWFRTSVGVRADGYTFNVQSDNPANSGSRVAGIVSPKASLVFTLPAQTEAYVSAGYGFHSNDARGTTISTNPVSGDPAPSVSPLVRSKGGELGFRIAPLAGMRSTLSLWTLHLDSELLFIGDGGATEPSAASARRGITLANFYRPLPALSIDGDVSLAHAEFRGVAAGASRIPGALEHVLAGGIAWNPARHGLLAALRVRHFGAYPLTEDNSMRATPSTLVNGDVGFRLASGASLQLNVLNLFNTKADDIQYYYASRLEGEGPAGVDDVHFHPAEPRQVRLSVEWRF